MTINAKQLFAGALFLGLIAACEQSKPEQPKTPAAPATMPAKAPEAPPQPAQPAEPAQPAAPVAAGAGNPANGKKHYMIACVNCHGPDGTGQMMRAMMPKIGDLTSAEMHGRLKDEEIAALITNGRDKMPPFSSIFKPEQIKDIVAYVRSMKKDAPK